MKTSNFRHKVFCMAYELMKATGKAFTRMGIVPFDKTNAQRYRIIRL